MQNSLQVEGSPQVNPRVSGPRGSANPLNGVTNGRPPDSVWPALSPYRLERMANPVNEEDQQVVKRSDKCLLAL
ncbi:hypothetical protein V6N13_042696 [Hibiscus sabdariffa]|uniref:Uncharacterized protein n=1 Tax=Hibiscus sabdariffa TaxID=183260 RepID=A0ABR2G3V5_9ROSI